MNFGPIFPNTSLSKKYSIVIRPGMIIVNAARASESFKAKIFSAVFIALSSMLFIVSCIDSGE